MYKHYNTLQTDRKYMFGSHHINLLNYVNIGSKLINVLLKPLCDNLEYSTLDQLINLSVSRN